MTQTRRFTASLLFVLASSAGVAAFSLVSVEQEIAIGREAQQEVRSKVPALRDEDVTRYVERLGRRLAARAPGPRYPYSFSVASSRELNAFALPGGPIWLHRGILDRAETEAQVAGVLAHEIAHVAERHAAEQMTKATVANGLLGLLGSVLDGGRTEAAARIGAGLGTQFLFLKFSRDHEREADRVGAAILRGAGYDPNGMAEFFELLAREQRRSPGSVATFLSTHPAPGDRAAQLRRTSGGGGGRRSSAEFTAMKRDLRDAR
jgi:beta-barrel assembly-enhancing protease